MVKFSNKAKLDLIRLVSKQRSLYDSSCPNYKSTNNRAKVWEEIGKELKKKGIECRDQWIKLRKNYIYFIQNDSAIGETEESKAKAKLFKEINFLDIKRILENKNKKQRNEKKRNNDTSQQSNENLQSSHENPQQHNDTSQQSNENRQSSHDCQQRTNDTSQLSNESRQSGHENQQRNSDTLQQSNAESSRTNAESESNNSGQVNINVGSISHEETFRPPCQSSTLSRPKPAPQRKVAQKKNRPKSVTDKKKGITKAKRNKKASANPKRFSLNKMEVELDLFSSQVRVIMEQLPRDLQIKARADVMNMLSGFQAMLDIRHTTGVTSSATSTSMDH